MQRGRGGSGTRGGYRGGGARGGGGGNPGPPPPASGGRIVQQTLRTDIPSQNTVSGRSTSDSVISMNSTTNVVTSAPPVPTFNRTAVTERASSEPMNPAAGMGMGGFGGMLPQGMGPNHYAAKSTVSNVANPGATMMHSFSNPHRPAAPRPNPLANFGPTMSASLPNSVPPSMAGTYSTNTAAEYFTQPQQQQAPPPPRIVEQQQRLEQQLYERASQAQHLSDPIGRGRRRGPGGFSGRSLADLFTPEALRADLASRPAQSALMLDPEDPRIAHTPERVHEFHTLFPLDALSPTEEPQVGSLGCISRVYKAVSELDGQTYALRKLDGVRLTGDHNAARKQWAELAHPCVVRLRNIFITNEFDGGQTNSLTLVHDFIFSAATLEERHMRPADAAAAASGAVSEELLWSYIAQLMSAVRFIHGHGRALRCIHASKILVTPQHRLLLGGAGIFDVIGDRKPALADLQAEDLRALGSVLLQTVCRSMEATHTSNLSTSVDYLAAHYHPEFKDLVVYLISQPGGASHVTIFTASARVAARLLEQADYSLVQVGTACAELANESDYSLVQVDTACSELAKEIQNGRLCRLMVKLNMILERHERGVPAADAWSETGDRYLLKLFRDYVFHACEADTRPVVEFGAVMQHLNKLDVGVAEKIVLLSRDEQTCLVVSYADLKACFERSFAELLEKGNYTQAGMAPRRYQESWTGGQ